MSDEAAARRTEQHTEQPTGQPAKKRFSVDVERTGDVVTVRCHGELVAGVCSILYAEASREIPGSKRMVLDLTDLEYMDSMGLGTIMRLYVSTKSAGCQLELINLGKRIRELLGVTNLLGIFTTIGETGIRIP